MDYRQMLLERIAVRKKEGHFTLRSVAEKIGVQYTFLSRALRHPDAHLNERHLYAFCEALKCLPEEIDEIFLRRDHDLTQHPGRRMTLAKKLNARARARGMSAEVQAFDSRRLIDEAEFLLDPFGMVVFAVLQLPQSRRGTRWIGSSLGLSLPRLKEILKRLERLGIVEPKRDGETVVEVLKQRIHYPPDHPFMRTHQARLREISGSFFERAQDPERQRFMVTFSGDETSRRKISERFDAFLKEVEQIAKRAPNEKAYQLSFELFPWG